MFDNVDASTDIKEIKKELFEGDIDIFMDVKVHPSDIEIKEEFIADTFQEVIGNNEVHPSDIEIKEEFIADTFQEVIGTMSGSDESCEEGPINSVIDTEKLIIEVEKRPAIYNKQLKEYGNRENKEKLWGEVCLDVIPNWNELSGTLKKNKGKDVQRKWKNLKDCFARELAAQRKTTSGKGAKKRRKYIHFESLLFLLPFTERRETNSNISMNAIDAGEQYSCLPVNNSQSDQVLPVPNSKKKFKKAPSYEESLLNILKAKQEDEVSEDKNFALMLVPMLGKLNDDQKHFAKVEILNVMKNARYFQPQTHEHHTMPSTQVPYYQPPPNRFPQTFPHK